MTQNEEQIQIFDSWTDQTLLRYYRNIVECSGKLAEYPILIDRLLQRGLATFSLTDAGQAVLAAMQTEACVYLAAR